MYNLHKKILTALLRHSEKSFNINLRRQKYMNTYFLKEKKAIRLIVSTASSPIIGRLLSAIQ